LCDKTGAAGKPSDLVMRRAEMAQARIGSSAMRSESAALNRDLAIPGSPGRSSAQPSPVFARSQRHSSRCSSSSRPKSGIVPERNAWNTLAARS
jgi:hypothetical protein